MSMSVGALPLRHPPPRPARLYGGAVLLLAVTFALGLGGTSLARPLFVLGSLGIGVMAWRDGPARHLELAVVLFCVAPLLRRVVDLGAGYDPQGLMLTGPLLALLVPAQELLGSLRSRRRMDPRLLPFLVTGGCIAYAALLALFQGEVVGMAAQSLKWIAPLAYGIWIFGRAKHDPAIAHGAVRAFVLLTPLMGLYGGLQYVDPPAWDRYWMVSSQMDSIGLPQPFMVRVFSTMKSPASFATFTAYGLLLIGFCRPGWTSVLLALPGTIGLLLSLYRTAWLALVAGVLFCLLFTATRRRALAIMVGVGVAISATMLAGGPFGDVLSQRLATLTAPGQDGSGQERLGEYVQLYAESDHTLFGHGFTAFTSDAPGHMPIDGVIVYCWLAMGIVVGLVFLSAAIWAGLRGMAAVRGSRDPVRIVLGAIIVAALAQMPLAGAIVSETGFVFWTVVALATARPRPAPDATERAP